jgi:hypothetical protein
VAIAVGQEHRPVGYHRIQQVAGRDATGEGVHGPAAAGNPLLVRVVAGIGGDKRGITGRGVRPF